jgi:hypothetical protein
MLPLMDRIGGHAKTRPEPLLRLPRSKPDGAVGPEVFAGALEIDFRRVVDGRRRRHSHLIQRRDGEACGRNVASFEVVSRVGFGLRDRF